MKDAIAVVASRVRFEEKLLFEALEAREIPHVLVDPRTLHVALDGDAPPWETALVREIGATRALYAALADGYWRQALYEEGQDRWAEAALSYSKVCNGRPNSAKAHERVAVATLKSSANIRRAVDFARRAVELEPKSPQFRLTLASAYMAAGLERSALGEIERALELAPGDQKIKDLAQQVRVQAQKSGN